MNIKHLIVTAVITIAASATAGALAAEENFAMLDADGDGYISMAEADKDATLKENWVIVDSNKDGKVERAEFSAFEEKPAEPAK